jgi:hypothetical protein
MLIDMLDKLILQIAHQTKLYITGIQLEAGTTASDFEFLPVDVNLNRCCGSGNMTIGYGASYS